MSNNSIKLCTKFGFCVSKFDHNCTQNLISGIFGVETRLPLQDVQILYLMCWDLYTVHLYAYAGTINVFSWDFSCCLDQYSFRHHTQQSFGNYESPENSYFFEYFSLTREFQCSNERMSFRKLIAFGASTYSQLHQQMIFFSNV